jgi:sialate O-acetylesterase
MSTSDGTPPQGFIIAGADHVWHHASARVENTTAIVSSPDVPAPVAVRYGWANDPVVTLMNLAALPAAPFRTDNW